MMRTMLVLVLLLAACATTPKSAPDPGPSVTVDVPVDAGLPPTDLAGIVAHQCSVLCSVCHDQLDGGDCASNCAQLLYSIQGEVDTVCVGYAQTCDQAVRCIF